MHLDSEDCSDTFDNDACPLFSRDMTDGDLAFSDNDTDYFSSDSQFYSDDQTLMSELDDVLVYPAMQVSNKVLKVNGSLITGISIKAEDGVSVAKDDDDTGVFMFSKAALAKVNSNYTGYRTKYCTSSTCKGVASSYRRMYCTSETCTGVKVTAHLNLDTVLTAGKSVVWGQDDDDSIDLSLTEVPSVTDLEILGSTGDPHICSDMDDMSDCSGCKGSGKKRSATKHHICEVCTHAVTTECTLSRDLHVHNILPRHKEASSLSQDIPCSSTRDLLSANHSTVYRSRDPTCSSSPAKLTQILEQYKDINPVPIPVSNPVPDATGGQDDDDPTVSQPVSNPLANPVSNPGRSSLIPNPFTTSKLLFTIFGYPVYSENTYRIFIPDLKSEITILGKLLKLNPSENEQPDPTFTAKVDGKDYVGTKLRPCVYEPKILHGILIYNLTKYTVVILDLTANTTVEVMGSDLKPNPNDPNSEDPNTFLVMNNGKSYMGLCISHVNNMPVPPPGRQGCVKCGQRAQSAPPGPLLKQREPAPPSPVTAARPSTRAPEDVPKSAPRSPLAPPSKAAHNSIRSPVAAPNSLVLSAESPLINAPMSPLGAARSPLNATRSPLNAPKSPLNALRSSDTDPVNAPMSPLGATRSPLNATRSPLNAPKSPLNALRSSDTDPVKPTSFSVSINPGKKSKKITKPQKSAEPDNKPVCDMQKPGVPVCDTQKPGVPVDPVTANISGLASTKQPSTEYSSPVKDKSPGYGSPAKDKSPGYNKKAPAKDKSPGYNRKSPAKDKSPGYNKKSHVKEKSPGYNRKPTVQDTVKTLVCKICGPVTPKNNMTQSPTSSSDSPRNSKSPIICDICGPVTPKIKRPGSPTPTSGPPYSPQNERTMSPGAPKPGSPRNASPRSRPMSPFEMVSYPGSPALNFVCDICGPFAPTKIGEVEGRGRILCVGCGNMVYPSLGSPGLGSPGFGELVSPTLNTARTPSRAVTSVPPCPVCRALPPVSPGCEPYNPSKYETNDSQMYDRIKGCESCKAIYKSLSGPPPLVYKGVLINIVKTYDIYIPELEKWLPVMGSQIRSNPNDPDLYNPNTVIVLDQGLTFIGTKILPRNYNWGQDIDFVKGPTTAGEPVVFKGVLIDSGRKYLVRVPGLGPRLEVFGYQLSLNTSHPDQGKRSTIVVALGDERVIGVSVELIPEYNAQIPNEDKRVSASPRSPTKPRSPGQPSLLPTTKLSLIQDPQQTIICNICGPVTTKNNRASSPVPKYPGSPTNPASCSCGKVGSPSNATTCRSCDPVGSPSNATTCRSCDPVSHCPCGKVGSPSNTTTCRSCDPVSHCPSCKCAMWCRCQGTGKQSVKTNNEQFPDICYIGFPNKTNNLKQFFNCGHPQSSLESCISSPTAANNTCGPRGDNIFIGFKNKPNSPQVARGSPQVARGSPQVAPGSPQRSFNVIPVKSPLVFGKEISQSNNTNPPNDSCLIGFPKNIRSSPNHLNNNAATKVRDGTASSEGLGVPYRGTDIPRHTVKYPDNNNRINQLNTVNYILDYCSLMGDGR